MEALRNFTGLFDPKIVAASMAAGGLSWYVIEDGKRWFSQSPLPTKQLAKSFIARATSSILIGMALAALVPKVGLSIPNNMEWAVVGAGVGGIFAVMKGNGPVNTMFEAPLYNGLSSFL